jgi:gamma-glutamylcysteine synthetase
MTALYVIVFALALFYAGKRYGARAEKAAVSVALAAFTEARSALRALVSRAQAEAKAEVERLESLSKKYL